MNANSTVRKTRGSPVLALKEQPIAIGRGSLNETHIIDNNISTGPQLVLIQSNDRAFLTHGCQPWQKAD